jgi:hypothetical protein
VQEDQPHEGQDQEGQAAEVEEAEEVHQAGEEAARLSTT